jgi:hypothetical protein
MQELTGDIWQLAMKTDAIVIPTNIGWKSDGRNVMGRGLARQAARRWPELPAVYGDFCETYKSTTPIMMFRPPNMRWCRMLLLLPVKPLDREKPYLSWRQEASLPLIEHHVQALANFATQYMETDGGTPFTCDNPSRILVPTVGCGNGGLDEALVLPVLKRYLDAPCFFHVRYEGPDAGVLQTPVH